MRKFIFLLLSFSVLTQVSGQITINNTLYTPAQLIDGVLIPIGSGVTVSNVTFSGVYNSSNRYQVGHFTTATTTLSQMGFSSGIVLSTGNTSDIPLTLGSNPQAAAQMSTGYTSCTAGEVRETGTCPTLINDVNILSGTENYFNAAILEFDFIPVGDVVQFRYIFGSEEFTDNSGLINYQCSSYNDQFGFLISGPGVAGGQGFTNNARNIARLANGSQVSINAVNNGVVGSSGGSPSASLCQTANPNWVQGTPTLEYFGTIDGTQLNGNTIILTAEQSNLTPGETYHIKLIITDVNDAAYDAVVYLEAGSFTTSSCVEPAAPTTGSITQPDCFTTSGSVALSGLPSTGNWTLTASPGGATFTNSGSTYNFTDLPSGTYTFTVTDDLGCISPSSGSVVIDPQPVTPSTPDIGTVVQPSCTENTGSVELTNLPAGNWTITSSPGSTISGSGTTYLFTGLPANSTFTYIVANDQGCSSPSTAQVNLNAVLPTPSAPLIANITHPDCTISLGSVELNGLPTDGSWVVTVNPGGTTLMGSGTTGTFTDLIPGNYTFTVINENGCTSVPSENATINNIPLPPSLPTGTVILQPTCNQPTGTIEATAPIGAFSYSLDGTNFQSSTTFSVVAPGTYTITVQDDNTGCTTTSSTPVVVDPVPFSEVITIDADSSIEEGQSISINASGNGTISWDNGDNGNTISVSPLITTTYCATLTDANGCTDTDCVTITVNSVSVVCGDLFIPTAFSPNGDNNNSSFGVSINPDCVETINLKVYDRWGEIIFESADPLIRWDGTFKSKELDPAVFVFVVRIKTTEMTQEETFKGNVTLMK